MSTALKELVTQCWAPVMAPDIPSGTQPLIPDIFDLRFCRFGKQVPTALKELVTQCWAPVMDDRPDFGTITRRLEHIAKALPEVREQQKQIWKLKSCS